MFPIFGLDQLTAKFIGVVLLVLLLVGGYYYWEHSVRSQALLEWNKKQQEQVVKQQEKLIQDLTAINKNQQAIMEDVKARNQALEKKLADLDEYLNKDSTVRQYKGKGSSEVLRRTFKELNK